VDCTEKKRQHSTVQKQGLYRNVHSPKKRKRKIVVLNANDLHWIGLYVPGSPVISSTNQLGDTSRSTRRPFISFECLFRIDRTKQVEQESRAIAGKPCNAAFTTQY